MIDRLYKIIFKSRRVFPIGISDEVTKSITTYYHLSKKVPTIENGIDLDRFSKTTRLDQRHYDVTMVARFSEVKNHEFALTLFERIHSQCPNAQFALAGQGELLARCQSFAQSRNMDYLHFLGLVEDVPSLLNQSKVLMLCSHHEANPLSLLEGMASGCIIVASKVGGIPNIVKNGESGFLYDLSEPGEFQGKISEIINNPKTYEKMSDKNAENSKRFGLNLMSSHYIEFFSQHITTEK
jgi:glycosyltransferase involved in cell wall biosynthesis